MNPLPKRCPICANEDLTITGFFCRECDSKVEGRFYVTSPFAGLSAEQLAFVETFVRCEGKFTRMETELGISYPTIRGRLHEIIRALGHEPGKDETPILTDQARQGVLEALEAGQISYDEAMRLLQGD
ncbi:MAG: DUF2089 domain-containing protein [Caldilineaceae bacterium]|nr:DUF2089 domain-containing protein [Caldilineaceae bacterium]